VQPSRPFDELARASRAHLGVITARELGALRSNPQTRRLVDTGVLERLHHGVYRFATVPRSEEQLLYAAVVAGGSHAVASHRSAAALWGLTDEHPAVPEVCVPGRQRPRLSRVIVHRSEALGPRYTSLHRGIRVTNPMMTILQVAAVTNYEVVDEAIHRAEIRRLFRFPAIENLLDEVGRSGRDGSGILRSVLDDIALRDKPPDGLLEPRFARLARRFGLPPYEFQYVVHEGEVFIARIDFAWPALKLAVEVDGYEHRASRKAFQLDLTRQTLLGVRGWVVLRFSWHDVVRRPAWVAAQVAAALNGRAAA
jgi:hypothetical protein